MTVSSEIITAEFFRAMQDNMEQLKLAYASENRERILDLDNEFHEIVGYVAEIGESAKKVKVGDRVIIDQVVPCGHCYACRKGVLTFDK